MTRVWHVMTAPADRPWKYGGRAQPKHGLSRSFFCNPFPIASGASRGSTLTDYFGFVMSNPGIVAMARSEFAECDGACWCAPPEGLAIDDDLRCHLQVLARAARGDYDRDFAQYVAVHTAGVEAIREFTGPFWFLSNFSFSPTLINRLLVPTNEHGFQLFKLEDDAQRPAFLAAMGLSPQAAKNAGRRVKLRPGWDGISPDVMGRLVRAKFSVEPFASMLDATGDLPLYEGNRWGDRLWGCDALTLDGENRLGKSIELRRAVNRGIALDPYAPARRTFALGTAIAEA